MRRAAEKGGKKSTQEKGALRSVQQRLRARRIDAFWQRSCGGSAHSATLIRQRSFSQSSCLRPFGWCARAKSNKPSRSLSVSWVPLPPSSPPHPPSVETMHVFPRRQWLLALRPHPSRLLRRPRSRDVPETLVVVVSAKQPPAPARLAEHAAMLAAQLVQRVCRSPSVCRRWNSTRATRVLVAPSDQHLHQMAASADRMHVPSILLNDNAADGLAPSLSLGLFASNRALRSLIVNLKPL